MINTFTLNKHTPIFLYGDNYIARRLCNNLIENGYVVKAIIDRKYKVLQIESSGLALLSLDILQDDIKDAIVIVCLSNGLVHEIVLSDLMKKGFENIIYLPMITNRPLWEQEILRCTFLFITNGCFDFISCIPKTTTLSKNNTIILLKNQKQTAFLCPVSLVRTASEKIVKMDVLPGRGSYINRIWMNHLDVQIEKFEPFKQLFAYFMGIGEYPDTYLNWMRETEEERVELLENRKQLFNIFEQNYEYNFSFFLFSPTRVEWNNKGYMNICDGLHRCIYLMMKGKKLVPVVLSNEDYMAYEQYRKHTGN